MHILVLTLLLGSVFCTNAQSVSTRLGGRAAAMGYASFSTADASAFFNNVGALGHITQSSVHFCYEAATQIPGANRTGVSLAIATPIGTAGFGVFRFGDLLYNEQILGVAFSNRIGITSLGVKFNYVQYQADGFGMRNAVTLDLGGLTQITPQISIGAGIFNITQSNIADDEELPVILVAALGFQPTQQFQLAVELEKRATSPAVFKVGVEHSIYKKLFIRTGFNLNPTAIFGGIGLKTNRISIDYAMKFSHALGFIHQASASLQLKSTQKK